MIDWQAFHFIRPLALLGILLLPLLSFLLVKLRHGQSKWRSVIPAHLQQHLLVTTKSYLSLLPYWLLASCWIIGCIAFAGPTWEKLPQPVYQSQTGKVIIMDMSLSMRSTDMTPDRLTRARFKALDLLDLIDDGEVGLIAYAGDAFTISPLTEDVSNIKNLIPSLTPEIMPVMGSNPYAALDQAKQLLENAGYSQGDIYWLTDGIEFQDIELIREFVDQNDIRISVLTIGTARGAPITQIDGTLLKDAYGNIVIPKLDTGLLKRALTKSTAKIVQMTTDDSDIQSMKFDDGLFEREIEESDDERTGDLWRDMGAQVLLLLLPLVALFFRRGLVLALAVMIYLGPQQPAAAQDNVTPNNPSAVQKLFLNSDQLAKFQYENQAYKQAQETFRSTDWKAAAAYKAGDFETAAYLYNGLEGVKNTYNLGNSLANLGQFEQAIDAYDQVLQEQPEHKEAMANKALLEQLMQDQQNQSQNQDSQNQEQQQSNQDQQQEQQQQNSETQSQDQSESQSQDQNNESPDQEQNQQQQSQNPSDPQQQSQEQQSDMQQQETEQDPQSMAQQKMDPSQMSPEEREELRQMQMLLNKIPDDPAFLLKRKMMVESQRRRQQGAPLIQQQNW